MYLVGDFFSATKTLQAYSLNTQPMNCSWNNSSALNTNNTYISDVDVEYSEIYSWIEVDIRNLAHSWLNYGRTSQYVGVPSYGLKIITTDTNPKATVVANSERASYNQPFFQITYIINSDYTMCYVPYKYNNIIDISNGNIYNFQNRMNCYAYALQIYDRGSSNTTYHRLMPGEIGILENGVNYTNNLLNAAYNNCSSLSAFMNLTEQQMIYDSEEMGTNLTRFYLNNNVEFELPDGYNENNQRIIAMNAGIRYYSIGGAGVYPEYDYHFYLRHGNGTCMVHNNSTCSAWSHKLAEGKVSCLIDYEFICDENIATKVKQLQTIDNNGVITAYISSPYFYTIEQDTNVYDSWYEYNSTIDRTSYNN